MAFGYTRTLPTITGIHPDFPILFTAGSFPTEAVDGGSSSILNGGGNLRAYTDITKTTPLPVEVVTFVTGVTPDVQVWIKIPTAATGNTIYIEADASAISQPSPVDPIGRNAVWSDYDMVSHDGGETESTGDTFVDDGSGAIVSSPFGDATTAPKNRLSDTSVADRTTNFTYKCWHNGLDNGTLLSRRDGTTHQCQWGITTGSVYFCVTTGDSGNFDSLGNVPAGWVNSSLVVNSPTNISQYINGSLSLNVNRLSISSQPAIPLRVGYRGDGGLGTVAFDYPGLIGESRVRNGAVSGNWILTEHENESDPDNWGTSSAWEDSAAPTVATSGTAVPTSTETDIVTGGRTIVLTLTGDTWVAAGATFDAIRQDIIDGLNSAQSELTGWNNEVRDKEVVTAVVRTSSTVVTITLSPSPLYDITATETITATVPASALLDSTSPLVSIPTFTVTSVTPSVAIPVIINANQLIGG